MASSVPDLGFFRGHPEVGATMQLFSPMAPGPEHRGFEPAVVSDQKQPFGSR